MASSAVLKQDLHEFRTSASSSRVNTVYWDSVEQSVRRLLSPSFKPWEVEAIAEEATKCVRETGGLSVDGLSKRLHARQFPAALAKQIAEALVSAFAP